MMSRSIVPVLLVILLAAGPAAAAATDEAVLPKEAQGVSFSGKPLLAAQPDQDALEKLDAAREDYEQDPQDADSIIWYGRRMAYTGDYRSAIRIFTDGIEKHPRDARMYRHRGHRYISVREIDRAIEDLEFAVRLIRGQENAIEPDGMPNALNIPVSTLHGNIWYHLGLAYYLKHDWQNAYRAFQAGFETGGNDDNRVSTTHWRYMILRRMGKPREASRVLDGITPDMNVIENTVYHRLCLFYRKRLSLAEVASDEAGNPTGDAAAYGIANWFFYNGDQAEARKRLMEITSTDGWDSFGFIAAEADLAHMNGRL